MHIRVIGAHLPRLDAQSIESFIANDVAEFKVLMAARIEQGKSEWNIEELDERALEIAEELRSDLQKCALFEVEVIGNKIRFQASDFSNPVTGLCGWEPAYLSLDGESVVAEGSWVPPEIERFRAAFYIHEWGESGRVLGPTGELSLLPFTAVPARLWRLAPYACLD